MRIIRNSGAERVIDLVRPQMQPGYCLDAVTPALSLFAFAELMKEAARLDRARLLLPQEGMDLSDLGSDSDRASRNQLRTRWLAKRFAEWLAAKAEVRRAVGRLGQTDPFFFTKDSFPAVQAALRRFPYEFRGRRAHIPD